MIVTKTKKLSNNTVMIGHFFNENKNSIYSINVKKNVYIKRYVKIDGKTNVMIEERPLSFYIAESKHDGVDYESRVKFGDKFFFQKKYASDNAEKSNPNLVDIWNKPMAFEDVRKIVEAFAGNYKKNPLNFTNLNNIQSEVKDNWESMQLFILSGEIKSPEDDYLDMMLKGNIR